MAILITATLKSFGSSYNTRDYIFLNKEQYDNWFIAHNKDHKKGKIIGILREKTFDMEQTKQLIKKEISELEKLYERSLDDYSKKELKSQIESHKETLQALKDLELLVDYLEIDISSGNFDLNNPSVAKEVYKKLIKKYHKN